MRRKVLLCKLLILSDNSGKDGESMKDNLLVKCEHMAESNKHKFVRVEDFGAKLLHQQERYLCLGSRIKENIAISM